MCVCIINVCLCVRRCSVVLPMCVCVCVCEHGCTDVQMYKYNTAARKDRYSRCIERCVTIFCVCTLTASSVHFSEVAGGR